jgi:glutamate N-acetyltransferase/amino-acid N-acetyltransferase
MIRPIKGGITATPGFRAAGIYAGIKKARGPDLALIAADRPCTAAGVFTQNRFAAPCVWLAREHLRDGRLQAIVANSGNANACTGAQGERDTVEIAGLVAKQLGIAPDLVAPASTGVIGANLPMDALRAAVPRLVRSLSHRGGRAAARAILTTDTHVKEAAVRGKIGGRSVTVGGVAKGSGMIHPNMATMLAFLTTDANVDAAMLQELVQSAVTRSFNMITVDGETSTNDMVLCLANGRAGHSELRSIPPAHRTLQAMLDEVCIALAKMIARDGEGATKLIEVQVRHAPDPYQARAIALAIGRSPLVKTAIHAADANWGRIMAAIGASGADLVPQQVDISVGDVKLVANGIGLGRVAERAASRVLKQRDVPLLIDLHAGTEEATAWTCDLSEQYVRINATYRS